MEAATPLRPDRVVLAGERLRIDSLVVDDERAVALARERAEAGEPLEGLVRKAIEIGARVIGREQTAADTEFVRAEFERQARELEQRFAVRAQTVSTDLTQRIDIAFGAEAGVVPRLLERHFGAGSSQAVQHQVRALVDDLLRTHREALARQFSATDASNPLGQFQQSALGAIKQASTQQHQQLLAMHETIVALKAEVASLQAERERAEAVAEEAERGTAKGRTYEEQVADALRALAGPRGDVVAAVGDRSDAGRSKKGDVVVDIGMSDGPALGRIAFEAKDRRLAQPEAIRELDGALAARDADFAVLVVPSAGELPAGMRALSEYHGDKMVVMWSPEEGSPLTLEVAYMLARARVLLARRDADARLDAGAIAQQADKALQALKDVRKVRLNLTAATTGIDQARDVLDSLEKAVRGHLDEIRTLLTAAGES
ncbi:MAG TPA: hypothetical protein VMT10_07620 [Solirubrobacteraceae bacterium]|nr:hypothetical protein [Solirubrobacteraceae bacterium]